MYLLIVLGVLTGRPLVALGVCVLFGLVRGLAVLLGRGITSPEALAAFHRRFMRLGPVALAGVVTVEAVVATVTAWTLSPWLALALALATATASATLTVVVVVATRSGGSRSARTA